MNFKTFSPEEFIIFQKNLKNSQKIISPTQTHSNNIIEIKTGSENLENCDGLFVSLPSCLRGVNTIENQRGDILESYLLTIKTADCAPIVFISKNKFGVIHAGWRGLCGNIIENMLENFSEKNIQIYVGPILPRFEIQKDFCYEKIQQKFGNKFFEIKNENIFFNFKEALKSILPPQTIFDERNTFEEKNLASWRENKTDKRNFTIVGDF